MKKKSVLMLLCALMSVVTVGAFASCEKPDDSQTQSSVSESDESVDASNSSSGDESSDSADASDSSSSAESGDSASDTESSGEEGEPLEDVFTFMLPTEDDLPCIDSVKEYLLAGAGANVANYHQSVSTQVAPLQIKWRYDAEGARKFIVEYATKADFSDAVSVEAGAAKRSVDVYNLYKATKYYVRITALNSKGETLHTAESEFTTSSIGPRFMYVDDVRNMRDLGGYQTSSGKTLVQGIAYRSGALTAPPNNIHYSNSISEDGKAYMSDVLGIKTEIDFRTASESGVDEDKCVIPGATLNYITLNGYADVFQYHKQFREFFSVLADPSSYPVIMHCTGGADRTGSVVYLLHTLLGVSELECLQGYELTSFSTYGLRNTKDGGTYQNYFDGFIAQLNTYEGNTLQEKTQTWLLSTGVTQEQIDMVKAIFYGEIAVGGENVEVVETATVLEKDLNDMYVDASAGVILQKKKINSI